MHGGRGVALGAQSQLVQPSYRGEGGGHHLYLLTRVDILGSLGQLGISGYNTARSAVYTGN